MLKIKTGDNVYIFELFLMVGICSFMMLQKSNIVSDLFHLTFIALLVGLLIQLRSKPWINELHVLAVLIIVLSFIHVAAQADTWALSYYNKLIIFSSSSLMIPFIAAIEINRRHVNWILGTNLCIAAIYPLMYFGLSDPGYLGRLLTLHFSNPNLTAMFLLHSVLYCAIALYYFKKKLFRLIILALMLMLVYFIYLTEARSCYLSLAFFAVLVLLNVGLKKDVRFSRGISLLILLLPLILAIGYLFAAKSGLLERFFSFFALGAGKTLTSRVEIWSETLVDFIESPLLGDYYGISDGTGMSQMHNTHLDILASYGIAPFVMFMMLLHKGVTRILPLAVTNFSRMALFAFFTVILQGTFEAALVSGGVGLYIMSFGFLLLAKVSWSDEKTVGVSKSSVLQ